MLKGRPWSFDKSLLVVQEYNTETRPSRISFDHSPFWIRILDLPRAAMTGKAGEMIGNAIGKCMSVDVDDRGQAKGMNMRIQVLINIRKPLRRGIKLIWVQRKRSSGSKFNMKECQTFAMAAKSLVMS